MGLLEGKTELDAAVEVIGSAATCSPLNDGAPVILNGGLNQL